MEYTVTRTSQWDKEEPPCDGVIRKEVPTLDTRICTEDFYNSNPKLVKHSGKWRDFGTGHTVLPNGHIQRQVGTHFERVIEINTLEELHKFMEQHEPIILFSNNIEIYDGYRE